MRIVIALGGNALLRRAEHPDADVQLSHVREAAAAITPLTDDHEIVITHGNGPQVGLLAIESAADAGLRRPYPLDVLDAETQGMIGYLLQQELHNAGVARPIATLVTQTVVASGDPAFLRPTKFIGSGFDEATARRLALSNEWRIARDGEQWRRVVASPEPRDVVEVESIRALLATGAVVVAAGGGGAAVTRDGPRLHGVEAIVDKDLTAALLATQLHADLLVILTDVAGVHEGWGTPDAHPLATATSEQLRAMQLPDGSMGPKVEAVCRFVERTGNRAVIGALADVVALVRGTAGTQVLSTHSHPPAQAVIRI